MSLSLVHVSEAGKSKSNGMEIIGFKRALKELEEKGIKIKQITTNRHKQIRRYLLSDRKVGNKNGIVYQNDVWHTVKGLRKKLKKAANKNKDTKILHQWIRSICNHLWYSAGTCNGDF